jgi:hypothetical protein
VYVPLPPEAVVVKVTDWLSSTSVADTDGAVVVTCATTVKVAEVASTEVAPFESVTRTEMV